jgi:iron(III) transport system permease protein
MLLLAYFTRYLGYGVRQSSGALVQVSDELVEAARISGAMPLRAFRDITLPLLKPAVLSLWTLLFIFFFVEVAATILLYSPKTATLPVVLWVNMAAGYPTRGFAVAVFQASLILGVLFVANRLFGVLKNMVER